MKARFASTQILMGIGDWGLGPIPNPQSPSSVLQSFSIYKINLIFNILNYINKDKV